MRKTKITSKLMALLLTLTLSMALATSVYAAENDNNKTTETAETTSAVQPRGMVVAGGSTNLSNGTGTIYLTLDEDVYGAEFMFSVMGNPSGQYLVTKRHIQVLYLYDKSKLWSCISSSPNF